MEERRDEIYQIISINSVINYRNGLTAFTPQTTNPINIEIPNGPRYKSCEIEEGFIVVRVPQTYQLTQLPTSFQLIVSQGNMKYFGDNVTTTNAVGVFLIDIKTQIALSGNNDLISYSFKLLHKVKLENVNNNIQIGIVGRVIDATFPTNNELFTQEVYRNGLYYVNFTWNPTNCYFAVYMKLKLC